MNIRNLALSGALVAMFALAAVGCNENPTDPTSTTAAPTNLKAVSINASTVALTWTASTTVGATYNISWKGQNSAAVGSQTATGTSTTVSGLNAEAYDFTVKAVSGGAESTTGATVTWAPAARYADDALLPSTTIRIYEKASVKGSGLVLDPTKGGPRNISVAASADPTKVQLAMIVEGSNFVVGPAYAFPEYKNVDKFDSTVETSDSAYAASSLSAWYLSQSLDKFFTQPDRTVSAYTFQQTVTGANGRGFIIRLKGTDGLAHYARIFVKNDGSGKLLQGSGTERYVELEISYQATPNLPYAKRIGVSDSPAAAASHRIF